MSINNRYNTIPNTIVCIRNHSDHSALFGRITYCINIWMPDIGINVHKTNLILTNSILDIFIYVLSDIFPTKWNGMLKVFWKLFIESSCSNTHLTNVGKLYNFVLVYNMNGCWQILMPEINFNVLIKCLFAKTNIFRRLPYD